VPPAGSARIVAPCQQFGSSGCASSFSIGNFSRNVMQVTAVLFPSSILSGILLCESDIYAFHF